MPNAVKSNADNTLANFVGEESSIGFFRDKVLYMPIVCVANFVSAQMLLVGKSDDELQFQYLPIRILSLLR